MNVLSLFDGMSCGRLALHRAGIPVTKYYASEVDKYAIEVAKKNFPDTIHVGDVTKVDFKALGPIDLLIGGSPCQGFSFAGKQLNFDDPRSKLFFEYVRALEECKPHFFILENVRMKKESEDIITKYLGVEPIMIDSNLVSAQNRKRLYWTNFLVSQPKDRGILLQHIAMTMPPTSRLIHSKAALDYMDRKVKGGRSHWDFKHHSDVRDDKAATLVANLFKGIPYNVLVDWNFVRKFHPIECERLQTLPDGYTHGVSDTQRYKMIGNGWTVEVIAHLMKELYSL